jgi:hypothetical protein
MWVRVQCWTWNSEEKVESHVGNIKLPAKEHVSFYAPPVALSVLQNLNDCYCLLLCTNSQMLQARLFFGAVNGMANNYSYCAAVGLIVDFPFSK